MENGGKGGRQGAGPMAGLTEEAVEALVAQREVIHKALQAIFSQGWEAGYLCADQEWRRHCAQGLGDDPQETVQHMMQRWG